MKCTCSNCGGAGFVEVTCDDCNGRGEVNRSIRYFIPPDKHPHKEELIQLKKDMLTIEEKAQELIAMKPVFASAYQAQKEQAEREIEAQAEELLKKS